MPTCPAAVLSPGETVLSAASVQDLRVHSTELRRTRQTGPPGLALDSLFLSDFGDWTALVVVVVVVVLLPPEGWDLLTTRAILPFQLAMSMRFRPSVWLYACHG